MKDIAIARASELVEGYAAPTCRLRGDGRSSIADLDGFPLWVVRADLAPGARLEWAGPHGDEGLYVMAGELETDGRTCPAGGSVIVEAGAAAVLTAPVGATVVHFGPRDPEPPGDGYYGPPSAHGHGVHVIGPGGTYADVGPGRDTRMFADSTCETCRITFFFTGRDEEWRSSAHSHSADEILYLLHGTIHLGSYRLDPGDAVAIAGGRRYAFRSGPDGFAFLNYRRDASEQTIAGKEPLLEGGRARGLTLVNDVR
jgi:quercetin dioxygenase-like cupin family protein